MMRRALEGTFNQITNGDFSKKSQLEDFPRAWLPIGGNHASSWKYKQESQGVFFLEIRNSTVARAGIIQADESSLEVGKNEHWLVKVVYRSQQAELKAYLRLYPVNLNGDVGLPWEFCSRPQLEFKQFRQFKQIINIDSDIKFLRLETGVLGPGQISIYKLIAYPLTPKRLKWKNKNDQKDRPIEHIQSIGEILKPIRLAEPIPLSIPVNVQAKVDAAIRNLTPLRDRVQIYGSSQVPLATSSSGRAQVEINGHGFHESIEDVSATQTIAYTIIRDVSALARYSFAIYNKGSEVAYVQIQLSPDGLHWAEAGKRRNVEPETLVMITPEGFLRYTRVRYEADDLTFLRIWVQAQN